MRAATVERLGVVVPAMAQRVANVFRKMTADMMNVPEAGVWVVRANAWGTTLKSLAPWGVPLGLIGGA